MKTENDRVGNVLNVFSCLNPEKLINKKILILDDIITSGSTMCYAANSIIKSIDRYKETFNSEFSGNVYGNTEITGIVVASGRSS